ncbi:hypothetical protein pb186bvf_015648 [Paramecium bursaria]
MTINKQWIYSRALLLNIGTLSYAFTSNSMNNALNIMLIIFEVSNQNQQLVKGLLQSSFYIGALIGAILAAYIKRLHLAMMLCDACLFVGSSILIVDNLYLFLIGRVITGIGGGIQATCLPLFMRQISPTEIYGYVGGLLSSTFSVGYFLTMIYGIFFQDTLNLNKSDADPFFWRIYFFVGGIPSLIRLIVQLTICNFDTPKYYFESGQEEKALQLLDIIYNRGSNFQLELLKNKSEKKQDFLKQPYLNQFYFGLFLMFFFQFCGFNAVVQYSTTIFQSAYSEKTSKGLSFLISVLKIVLYTFTGSFVLGKYGRRLPVLIGSVLMTLANFAIVLFASFDQFKIVSLFVFLFVFGNFSSTGPTIPVYLVEIAPSGCIPYCYWTFWFYSVIILLLFPIIKEHTGFYCFTGFGTITLFSGIYFYKYGLETKDRTNSEISNLFLSKRKSVVESLTTTM